MALDQQVGDREYKKFVETDAGDTAVRTQPANIPGVSTGNTTTTNLDAAATYTGTWTDVSQYVSVMVSCKADVAGTLYMEFSDTGSGSAQSTLTYDCAAGIVEVHRLSTTNMYYRTRYLNGSSDQTAWYLTTLFGDHTALAAPANLILGQDADAIPVRSISEEFDIANGGRAGHSIENIFGDNPAISTASVPEDIWNGSGVYTGFPTGAAETIEVFSSDSNDDEGGSGAEKITVYGLDANFAAQSEEITLNGTSAVATTTTWCRLHRAIVTQSANGANTSFNAGTITIRHTTTTANVFAVMPAGINQTRICAFTVPAGHKGYIHEIFAEVEGNASATCNGALWLRDFGKPPVLKVPFTTKDSLSYSFKLYGGVEIEEKGDVALRITASSANNIDVSGEMDIIIIKQ